MLGSEIGLAKRSEREFADCHGRMIPDHSTFVLAIATVVLAVATILLVLESRHASNRQLGLKTWMYFREWFDTREMIEARRELAKLMRAYTQERHQLVPETAMNFFEDLGTVYNQGYIDKKLADATFSYYAVRWWEIVKPYVDHERKRHNEDMTLFADFEKLAEQMRQPEDVLDADQMKIFLTDENNIATK
jgi:hypothetical protein